MKLFKSFGCTALVYVPLQNRTKLDVTSERGIMVGLSEGDMCYQIYCSATNAIIQARDVTFIEDYDEQLYVDEERVELNENSFNPKPNSSNGVINNEIENSGETTKQKLKRKVKQKVALENNDRVPDTPDPISRRTEKEKDGSDKSLEGLNNGKGSKVVVTNIDGPEIIKKRVGRPKGSKNKTKTEK